MRSTSKTILPFLVVGLFAGACGDTSVPEKRSDISSFPKSGYHKNAIHALVERSGRLHEVQFPPVSEISERSQNFSPIGLPMQTKASHQPGLQAKAIIKDGDKNESFNINIDDPSKLSGWTLVAFAAYACQFGSAPRPIVGTTVPIENPGNPLQYGCPELLPWSNSFYILPDAHDCEQILAQEEGLLCIAQKLNEVAEAVSNVTWDIKSYCMEQEGTSLKIVFPPQADKDRFIARDLAIHTLANLALLDTVSGTFVQSQELEFEGDADILSCGSLYKQAIELPINDDSSLKIQIFGKDVHLNGNDYFSKLTKADSIPQPSGPDALVWPIDDDHIDSLIDARLRFQTHIYRSSGRLLKHLIETSVISDLSGAEQKRAKAADPLEGNRRAWGFDLPGIWNDPTLQDVYAPAYNTSEHAIRVIAGRWEIGAALPIGPITNEPVSDPWGDPKCGGIRSNNLLRLAYGPDASARINNIGVSVKGQQLALGMLFPIGIVLHPENYGAGTSLNPSVREVILKLLKETTAWNRGYKNQGSPDVAKLTALGQSEPIERQLASISDFDLRFALQRLYDLYRLHASRGEDYNPQLEAGLMPLPFASNSEGIAQLDGMNGQAFVNLQEMNFDVDMLARASKIMEASQCPGNFAPLPEPPQIQGQTWGHVDASRLVVNTFQDSFSLAQQFYRRLIFTRETARELDETKVKKEATILGADAGVAEFRNWAGPGYLLSYFDENDEKIILYAVGFRPEELGVRTIDQAQDNLKIVFGEPWVAECSAGLRTACPENFSADYEMAPSNWWSVDTATESGINAARYFGADDFVIKMAFDPQNAPPNFAPFSNDVGEIGDKRLYLVAKNDPKDPARKGKVLGALSFKHAAGSPPYNVSNAVMTPVSSLQRELLNNVLQFPGTWLLTTPAASIHKLAMQRNYCIMPGMDRDVFIPLENELTSDSDQYENSWRHYLNLAKAAAEETDRLGNELIQLGLQKDMRREQALEVIGDLCGTYAEAAKLSVNRGKVSPPPENSKVASCLNSDNVDVLVFYDQENFPATDETSKAKLAKLVLDCDGQNPTELCSDPNLKGDTLGLVKATPPSPNQIDPYCSELATSIQRMSSSLNVQPLNQLAASNPMWMSREAMQNMVKNLKMEIAEDGHWTVAFNGLPFMSTRINSGLWPGCVTLAPETEACQNSGAQAIFFSQVFRENAVISGDNPACVGTVFSNQFGNHCVKNFVNDNESRFLLAWRVQASLWLMSGRAGAVPEGMFTLPIPVAAGFKGGPELINGWGTGENGLFVPTVYGNAKYIYTSVAGSNYWMLDDATNSLQEQFSLVNPPQNKLSEPSDHPFLKPSSSSSEVPSWLKTISSDTWFDSKYFMLKASNRPIQLSSGFDFNILAYSSKIAGLSCETFSSPVASGNRPQGFEDWVIGFSKWKTLSDESATQALPFLSMCPTLRFEVKDNIPSPDNFQTHFKDAFVGYGAPYNDPNSINNTGVLICMDPITLQSNQPLNAAEGSLPPGPASNCGYDSRKLDIFPLDDIFGNNFDLDCRPYQPGGFPSFSSVHQISGTCLRDWTGATPAFTFSPFHGNRIALEPSICPPNSRVSMFVNSYPPSGECGAIAQYLQAIALSCSLGTGTVSGPITNPPHIDNLNQIVLLELWIDNVARQIENGVAGLYVTNIPQRVINDIKGGTVTQGDAGGNQFVLEQSMGKALSALPSSWINVAGLLRDMKTAVALARNELALHKNNYDEKNQQLVIQKLNVIKDIVNETAKAVSAWFAPNTVIQGNPAFWVNAAVQTAASATSVVINGLILKDIDDLQNLASKGYDLQVAGTIIDLNSTMATKADLLKTSFIDIQNQIRDINTISKQLQENQLKVAYQLGKATGEPYVLGEDGNPIATYPVNQVLNRQYDITENRYKNSLKHAKYLAYVARLAIEQRVGKKLSFFKDNIGPLAPPAEWADDVCTLQGIDYSKLQTIEIPELPSEESLGGAGGESNEEQDSDFVPISEKEANEKIIQNFADQYIGDYVRKLEQFVEYYNIKFPSHDGDDQVVLSLRDDLLRRPDSCYRESPNVLFYSGHLNNSSYQLDENGETVLRGWKTSDCIANVPKCISVHPGTTVIPPGDADDEVAVAFQNATWLVDQSNETTASIAPSQLPILQQNPASVYQLVHLKAGPHVLSWQDQSRKLDGSLDVADAPGATEQIPYRAAVFDEDGIPVMSTTRIPFRPLPEPDNNPVLNSYYHKQWSERHEQLFNVAKEGNYYLLFGASSGVSSELGSVLIREVQLEQSSSGKASVYSDVVESRRVSTDNCPKASASEVQQAFEYRCEKGSCFYGLKDPIFLQTQGLSDVGSQLYGKLAAGNYNYRHLTVAFNIVGTALVDCEKDPSLSCYGSGFLEYTLDHRANQVPILGYDQVPEMFNFGQAFINHGKALAAEHYITIPLSSSDAGLLAQPSIEKAEFRGRPLDGTYGLKIWDRPGLVWERLEDVQIVLRYRYWSHITGQSQAL